MPLPIIDGKKRYYNKKIRERRRRRRTILRLCRCWWLSFDTMALFTSTRALESFL
jgi:hypothetical protein